MSALENKIELYPKQVDVAREFGVTEATVHNWIKAAENGTNNLKIVTHKGKKCIVNNDHNNAEMSRLKEKGRKHASNISKIVVYADEDKLLDMFGKKTLQFLINNLDLNHKIPIKYDYFNGGAQIWDNYYKMTDYGNADKNTFEKISETIFSLLNKYDVVNVINVGTGNGLTEKDFVSKIKNNGKLGKYCLVDISKSMLEIATENLKSEFGNHLTTKLLDFEIHSFQELLFDLKNSAQTNSVTNLIVFSGSTIGNYPTLLNQVRILSNIRDGMTSQDYLLVTNVFDKQELRTEFPLNKVTPENTNELTIAHILGLNKDLFKIEFKYNEITEAREMNLILRHSTKIVLKKLDVELYFESGDSINVWNHKRDNYKFISEKLSRSNLELKFMFLNEQDIKVPEVCYLAAVA